MKEKEEKTEESKLKSRKFVVWLVWLIIAVLDLILDGIIIIITKNITDELISLTEKILSWFFAVSMMYLGMNVVQKGTFALADAWQSKKEEEQEGEK